MQPDNACRITYLRLSITDKCDLGCQYCKPYRRSLECSSPPLTVCEITTLAGVMAQNGVTKVRLTGGEPLLRDDVLDIVESVSRIPGILTIGLTTNGTRLAELAHSLRYAGVTGLNISLDSLDRETFRAITGMDNLDRVWKGILAALDAGFEKVKINTVVMRGINDSEVSQISDLARTMPVDVRFIELMPLGHTTEQWKKLFVPASEIRQRLPGLRPLPFDGGSSARMYTLTNGLGRIGIISPMSEHFCCGCNRIRVTSSGKLKPCLRLPVEYDIRVWLDKPDLARRLGALLNEMSSHKLTNTAATSATVKSETMCMVGG